MRKTTIIISSLIIFAGVIFYSCSKEESKQVDNKYFNKNIHYSLESAVDLASLHNKVVSDMYNQVNFSDFTIANDMIWDNFCNNVSIDKSVLDELEMSRDSFNLLVKFVNSEVVNCNFDMRNSEDYSMNGRVEYTYLVQLFSIADGFNDNSNVIDMIKKVDEVKDLASNNLSGNSLEFVLSVADVMKGSIKLWLPVNMGGDGYIELFSNSKGNKGKLTEKQKKVIGAALIADASSMAIGLQVTAWAALATGGTLTPVALVATCIEAAAGSAFSALVSWFS